ncbi:hypothetical protein [Pseudomonas sp. Pseu.R1]|uniref:hypothetical protein n=1 Tax=Pseudomonas sp. Pseu.R1 TaxID=3379818 RepID=UPI003B94764F
MNDMNIKVPVPLARPVVPVAYSDGLLRVTDLQSPISVEVEVWPAAETGYTVRLDLDGVSVTDERVITDNDKPGDILTLNLMSEHLRDEGTYRLEYRTYSPNTLVEDFSPPISLKVDRTPPGASLLAPMIFPDATFGNYLLGVLPGYAGMEAGDTIQTRCNGVPGPRHVVQPNELTVQPIEIIFDRAALQDLGTDNVSMSYTVTDRAGNESMQSVSLVMSLAL